MLFHPEMITITNNDYEAIIEVRRTGLSQLRPAVFEKDLLITKILSLLKDFDRGEFSTVLRWHIII